MVLMVVICFVFKRSRVQILFKRPQHPGKRCVRRALLVVKQYSASKFQWHTQCTHVSKNMEIVNKITNHKNHYFLIELSLFQTKYS